MTDPAYSDLPLEVRKEIGQHFIVGFQTAPEIENGGREVKLNEDIKYLIRECFVGGVILFKRNVKGARQLRALTYSLQKYAKECGHDIPLIIGVDQECGLVSAMSVRGDGVVQFPGAMALAASGTPEAFALTEKVYEATGQELKMLGVHWAFAPIGDVNLDKGNVVIGVRSFGDRVDVVKEFVKSAIKGLETRGIASCVKHFPGHGDTSVDSHLALPVIRKTREEVLGGEAEVWSGTNSASVMTGHIALPLITGTEEPASLSREITNGMLRGDLRFEGVVVTDCLEMDAISEKSVGGCGTEEGCVRALRAGADVVMVCHRLDRQRGGVWKARENWFSFDEQEKRNSLERIKKMKKRFVGDWQQVLEWYEEWEGEWTKVRAEHEQIAEEAYKRTITVVQPGQLPLKEGTKVVVYTPENKGLNRAVDDPEDLQRTSDGKIRNTAGASFLTLVKEMSEYFEVSHVVYKEPPEEFQEDEQVVFVTRNGHAKLRGSRKLIRVCSCTPYDAGLARSDEGVVCSFEYTGEALKAVVGVLRGSTQATGKLPVSI